MCHTRGVAVALQPSKLPARVRFPACVSAEYCALRTVLRKTVFAEIWFVVRMQGSDMRKNLRWGWVFLERTHILSGIQFTTHFIEFFVVETKRFVGSLVHVILTRQTCGQRSSKAAESKRRALRNYFVELIWYMF